MITPVIVQNEIFSFSSSSQLVLVVIGVSILFNCFTTRSFFFFLFGSRFYLFFILSSLHMVWLLIYDISSFVSSLFIDKSVGKKKNENTTRCACAVGFCQVDDKRIVTYTEQRQRRLLVGGVDSNQKLIFHPFEWWTTCIVVFNIDKDT
jgi:hypothetical protein